jgi:cellulose biosynthesis protein BcsQ
VIDGPPRNYEVTRSAIAAADLVLIPVQPSGADFWASRETVKLSEEHTRASVASRYLADFGSGGTGAWLGIVAARLFR